MPTSRSAIDVCGPMSSGLGKKKCDQMLLRDDWWGWFIIRPSHMPDFRGDSV